MSFADTFDFPSPDEQESDLRQALQWFSEIARLDHTFSEDDAINLANMARLYPTASAEVLTAAAEARIPYDLPSLAEVMAKEHETGGNFLSGIYDRAKWVSRNALMVADSIYESGVSRPQRFALGLAQGDDLAESWRSSGSTVLAEMVASHRRGEDYTLGEGFYAQPQQPEDSPAYRDAFLNALPQAQGNQPPDLSQIQTAHRQGVAAAPTDVSRLAIERNEERRLHTTVAGQQYEVPYSLGRLVSMQVVRPETVPFTIMSGLIDAPMRIGLDPLNIPADEITRAVKARRLLVPNLEDVVEVQGLTYRGAVGTTKSTGRIAMASMDEIVEDWRTMPRQIAELREHLDDALVLDDTPEAIAVLRAQIDELEMLRDRIPKVAKRSGQAEEEVYRQWVIGHERGHQLFDSTYAGREALPKDEITREFGGLPGTPGELRASQQATEIIQRRPRRAARDLKLYAEAGISRSGWRPWAQPTLVNDWFDSSRGRRIIDWIADEDRLSEIRRVFGDLSIEDQLLLTKVNSDDAIKEVLRRNLGITTPLAPRVGVRPKILGARTYMDPNKGARGGFTLIDEDSKFGRFYRRFLDAEAGGGMILDPSHPEDAIGRIEDYLNTIGGTTEDVDRIMKIVAENPYEWGSYVAATREIEDVLTARLDRLGYNADTVSYIMKEFRQSQLTSKIYFDDALGDTVHEIGNAWARIKGPDGEEIKWIVPHAAHEAQFHSRNLVLPTVREVRRLTSTIRSVTDKLRNAPLGLREQWVQARMDNVMSVWRNMALLRGGWMLRVLPDEIARILASGYGDTFGSPFSYVAMAATDRGSLSVIGASLDEQFRAMGGLGTNAMWRDIHNNPIGGTRFRVNNVTWVPQRIGEAGHIPGLTRALVQFHASDLARAVARMGVDEAFDYFRGTDEGMDILRQIAREAGQGNKLSRIDVDPRVLMQKLHQLDADMARYSGGQWIMRDPEDPTRWVDQWQQPYRTTADMTSREIDAQLRELGVAGRTSRDGRRLTTDEKRAILAQALDEPDLAALPYDQQFFVVDSGAERVRSFIAEGIDPLGTETDQLTLLRRLQAGDTENLQIAIVSADDAVNLHGYPEMIEDLTRPIDEFAGDWDMLGPDERLLVWEPTGRQTAFTAEDLKRTLPDPERGAAVIHDGMTPMQWSQLEDRIEGLYDTHAMPEVVRAPDPEALDKANKAGRQAVDTMFYYVGTLPTETVVRSPFARMKYWEEMARFYVHGDDAARAAIMTSAGQNGVDDLIQRFIDRHLRERGLAVLPQEGVKGLTLTEMDEIARRTAVNSARDLLYDLSKASNAADAARLAMPFADAWYEVLSRWARIMNPYQSGGQPLRNLRRVQQANYTARTQGWFEEDQFGNEVFSVPSWPFLSSAADWQIQPRISPDQLLFIDPGNPRSAMLPGMGPLVQFPASLLQPAFPPQMRRALNWAVFGDFPPADTSSVGSLVRSVLPTPYRRALSAMNADEYRSEYGDEIVETFAALVASGDPRFGVETIDRRDRTLKQAQKIGTQISIARIFDSAFLPGQPRYEAQMLVVRDVLNDRAEPYWLDIVGVGEELRAAEEAFGNREAAITYIMERFGYNPLDTVPASRQIVARPVTQAGSDFLEANQALRDHANFTLMAFVPDETAGEFFQPAWAAQFAEGARERYDVETASRVISAQNGSRAFRQVTEIYDKRKAEAEQLYGRDSNRYRAYMEQLDAWKADEVYSIQTQYWAWGEERDLVGATTRPTYGDYLEEVFNVGNPTTDAHTALSEINPELVAFYSHVTTLWRQAEELSLDLGFGANWWRSSERTTPAGPGEADAEATRKWFTDGLSYYVTQRMSDDTAKHGAQWLMDRVIGPLMAGYDFDEPMILDVTPIPNLTRPQPGDTLPDEILPRLEQELMNVGS